MLLVRPCKKEIAVLMAPRKFRGSLTSISWDFYETAVGSENKHIYLKHDRNVCMKVFHKCCKVLPF